MYQSVALQSLTFLSIKATCHEWDYDCIPGLSKRQRGVLRKNIRPFGSYTNGLFEIRLAQLLS